jgi:coenzyme F420-reducing hydrogenase alpha subunit
VDRLRQIAVWGEWIASHALSYFFLTLPDTLSTGTGVFDLMQEHPDIARDAFALRRAGDRIVEIVGKRPVHPVALGVGRFSILPTAADLAEIRRIVSEVKELSGQLIGRLAQRFEREARFPFPVGHHVNLFAYDGRPGQGRFKIIDRSGQVTAESDRDTLSEHVSEMRVDGSLAKFPYLTELAFPHGTLLVGPLSRLYLGGGVLDDPELENFELTRWLRDPATLFLDHLDECRLLEIFLGRQADPERP